MGLFDALARARRRRRAVRYLRRFPTDLLVVQVTLEGLELNAQCAREAAEMAVGHTFSDDDWDRVADRWERVWQTITPRGEVLAAQEGSGPVWLGPRLW